MSFGRTRADNDARETDVRASNERLMNEMRAKIEGLKTKKALNVLYPATQNGA